MNRSTEENPHEHRLCPAKLDDHLCSVRPPDSAARSDFLPEPSDEVPPTFLSVRKEGAPRTSRGLMRCSGSRCSMLLIKSTNKRESHLS